MKEIQAFVPSSSQYRNRNRKAITNSGKHVIKLHPFEKQQTRQVMMMLVPPHSTTSSEFQSEVPSLFPNFSSMVLGSDFEPAQTFEPQVNTPALTAFAIIAVVFSLLQFRINSVRDAATRRQEALAVLRQVKSEQLDSSSFSNNTIDGSSSSQSKMNNESVKNSNMDTKVKNAIKAYENALKEELNLRTILPGIRIVAPNDAARREEDIAAAKQFLDWDILLDEEDVTSSSSSNVAREKYEDRIETKLESDETRKMNLLMQSRRRFDGKENQNESLSSSSSDNETGTMSNGAKAILITVALSQIALLFLLSLDPMNANNMFTDIAGNPPDNIPLSSWSN